MAVVPTVDLDDQGRPARFHLDVPPTEGGTYCGFGTPVIVQAPPAEQIADTK